MLPMIVGAEKELPATHDDQSLDVDLIEDADVVEAEHSPNV